MTTEQRLEKAGKEFQRLEKRIEELESKFDGMKAQLAKKHVAMIDAYKWYLERLIKETDELASGK